MRVLILDNFDSFTHNLAQAFGALGAEVEVRRNGTAPDEVRRLRPDRLVISPGPGGPEATGRCGEVLSQMLPHVPVLGVCLGLQLAAWLYGARIVKAPVPVHGRATLLSHDGLGLFTGLPASFEVGRYHSLAVDEASLPESLVATAWSGGVLMGLRHVSLPLECVQFHPESVLTPLGPRMLANFMSGQQMRLPPASPVR